MKKTALTDSQKELIRSEGNLKVEAVAGSGKTTSLLEYAKHREGEGFGLYLAFNRAIKEEILKRIGQQTVPTLWIETAHSLAYRSLFKNKTRPLIADLTLPAIKNYLQLPFSQSTKNYLLARHIKVFFELFCQSIHSNIVDLDYLQTLSPRKGRSFATQHLSEIEKGVQELWQLMLDSKIPITHDFYLKQYQLSSPKLSFDWILFDEGQDASPVMLDIFLSQESDKVIVGDEHQQIYAWRSAVNSLHHTSFPSLELSKSFRCPEHITSLATQVVGWKQEIFPQQKNFIMLPRATNTYQSEHKNTQALIARTHLELIQKAIQWLFDDKKVKSIAFEGDFKNYLRMDDGSSIQQLLLLKRKSGRKKSFLYDWQQVEETAQASNDRSLKRLLELVKNYGNELPELLDRLQNRITEPSRADVTFTTAHKGKGLEWDSVHICNDFINQSQIQQLKSKRLSMARKQAINEEINTLYVAITRAREEVIFE